MKIKLLVFFLGLSVSLLAQSPEPTVLSIRINGQEESFNPKVPLQLSALDDDFVIQFRPLPNTQYQYFLENYDKSWGKHPIQLYDRVWGYIWRVPMRFFWREVTPMPPKPLPISANTNPMWC